MLSYEDKRDALVSQFHSSGENVHLGKDTSNLFRNRSDSGQGALNVRSFNKVLAVDPTGNHVEVEGMTPYSTLVRETLARGSMPCVVPQLRSITIGGAISGVGIESTSFRFGLVHESILEMDVLTGNGEVLTCAPDNEYSDLFFGMPNSYGTLGYVLRIRARTIPVKPFVKLEYIRHTEAGPFFDYIGRSCGENFDFLDGVMFAPGEFFVVRGTFADEAPYTSDYTYDQIYYKAIREKETDYLTTHDYIWRWDTDWFWCSKNVGAQNGLLRTLFGRNRLNSVFYTRIMRWNARWGLTRRLNSLRGVHTESVIQDVDIPIERACEFYEFFDREIGIRPVWVCPIGVGQERSEYPLYPMRHDQRYVNFGFWDVVRSPEPLAEGFYNKKVEQKVGELGGIKSLYSDVYYPREKFWQIYNQNAYRQLKEKYDAGQRLRDLYDKCVLNR
jgi:FAD/FMN-containing dehydrogenase